MAKIHPHQVPKSDHNSSTIRFNSEYMSSRRETFTLWMKSLVFHGNGCTVYNSTGEIVYRIDNYGKKSSNNEVFLMDLHGKVLFTIQKKKFMSWKGYKIVDKDQRPIVRVKKDYMKILKKSRTSKYCEIQMGYDELSNAAGGCHYKIVGSLATKSAFKIIDNTERVVAEVTRKLSSTGGVVLGNDVLSLVVEPLVDHSFIMALATVYGLINHQL